MYYVLGLDQICLNSKQYNVSSAAVYCAENIYYRPRF
jgi:hypothetical protein